MRYIFLNLKRFDISGEYGGVNSLAPMSEWGAHIVKSIQSRLKTRAELSDAFAFPVFFPEAHILAAAKALAQTKKTYRKCASIEIGCQGVHHADTAAGGNFGAFTGLRTANAAKELGCAWTLIGHSEERRFQADLMGAAGAAPENIRGAVHGFLNKSAKCAAAVGLKIVYCIGETAEETPNRVRVLREQIERGLDGIDKEHIVLAYEPVWAIGPGKTPPTAEQIAETAAAVKSIAPLPLVYGGGLKKENAESIGGIKDLDGGLIALTRFSGSIGFYPDEYAEIVDLYAKGARGK